MHKGYTEVEDGGTRNGTIEMCLGSEEAIETDRDRDLTEAWH